MPKTERGIFMELDYQTIINLAGTVISYSLPIGIVFGVAEKVLNLFFSLAFGAKNIRM